MGIFVFNASPKNSTQTGNCRLVLKVVHLSPACVSDSARVCLARVEAFRQSIEGIEYFLWPVYSVLAGYLVERIAVPK